MRWPRLLSPAQLSQLIRSQKNPLTALQMFNEAKTKYPTYHHNGAVYATMIDILRSSGKISEMKQVIDQMKEDSCECKDQVFASVINTYAKAGLFDDAVSLFRSLPGFNCVNWTASFCALLKIMMESSKLESFHNLFVVNSHGWEVKPRTGLLNLLMDALCRIHRSDLALEIFQDMSLQCCSPDRESYSILMRGLCEDGRLNEAIHLLYSMFWRISQKGCGVDITTYRILLDSLIDHGHVSEAVEMLGKVLRKGLKASKSCRNLPYVDQIHDTEDRERAKSMIHEALIRGAIPSLTSYSAVIIDLYSEGRIEEANQFLDDIRGKGFRPSVVVYEAKVSAMCKDGLVEGAARVVEEEMVRWNCIPTTTVFNVVIRGLCERGKLESAIILLEKMVKHRGCNPDKDTYDVLVNRLCHDRLFDKASKILERMLNNSFRPGSNIFYALVRGFCSTGRRYESVFWLEVMISHGMMPGSSLWSALVGLHCCNIEETGVNFEVFKRTESILME